MIKNMLSCLKKLKIGHHVSSSHCVVYSLAAFSIHMLFFLPKPLFHQVWLFFILGKNGGNEHLVWKKTNGHNSLFISPIGSSTNQFYPHVLLAIFKVISPSLSSYLDHYKCWPYILHRISGYPDLSSFGVLIQFYNRRPDVNLDHRLSLVTPTAPNIQETVDAIFRSWLCSLYSSNNIKFPPVHLPVQSWAGLRAANYVSSHYYSIKWWIKIKLMRKIITWTW